MRLTNVDMSESENDSMNWVKLILVNSAENILKWKDMKEIAKD